MTEEGERSAADDGHQGDDGTDALHTPAFSTPPDPPPLLARSILALFRQPKLERYAFALVMLAGGALILPFLGSVGFFDPWETHYGEVARSMAERDDYLYPFWKNGYFFSKPILLFWLTAPLYKLVGAGDATGSLPGLIEWCGRLPAAVFGLSMLAVCHLVMRRMWNLRAATLGGLALATLPFFGFMSRQAITDTFYVAPMTCAIAVLGWLFLDDKDAAKEKEQRRIPRWLTAFLALCILPQLWEIGRTGAFLNRVAALGNETNTRLGFSLFLILVASALLFAFHKYAKDPFLHFAAALLALATLGKGPHAVAFVGLVCFLYLLASGEWRILKRPALWISALVYLGIAAPWVIVMLLFGGKDKEQKTWYKRFVLYDLLGRLGGVHGERGTHEYYIRYLAFGMFPWLPTAVLAVIDALREVLPKDIERTRQQRFTLYVAIWAMSLFVFFTVTNTKFHHYCYPIAIPLAMIVGWWLDKKLRDGIAVSTALIAAICFAVAVCARDLVSQPWQLADLFTYHYVSYKPEYYFPDAVAFRIDKQVVTWWHIGLGAAFVLSGIALLTGILVDALGRPGRDSRSIKIFGEPQHLIRALIAAAICSAVCVVLHQMGYWSPRLIGLLVATGVYVLLGLVLWLLPYVEQLCRTQVGPIMAAVVGERRTRVENSGFVVGLVLCGLLSATFLVQGYWVAVSQHWTHRHIVDTYYSTAEPGEPLVAYQMDWKGETFYSHNTERQIMKSATDLKKVVEEPGRTFVIVQQDRYKRLKSAVGDKYKKKLKIIDQSNTKWYLVQIDD